MSMRMPIMSRRESGALVDAMYEDLGLRLAGKGVPTFPVRRMDYRFAETKKYWVDDDPAMTHFFTGMSLLFPEGESYFVRSVRALREGIWKGSRLDKEIGRFIGQEAMHSKEHQAFHVSTSQFGLNPESMEAFTGTLLKFLEKRLSKKSNLLVTTGIEHYTAVTGAEVMRWGYRHITDETMRNLWLWHAVEETEHKAVAYDLYRQLYGRGLGDYLQRVGIYTFISLPIVFGLANAYGVVLMKRDGQLLNLASWLKIGKVLSFSLAKAGWGLMQYYRPDFHPNQIDESTLLAQTKRVLGLS